MSVITNKGIEIINMIFKEFLLNDILSFNLSDLERQLFYYSRNHKYERLFYEFFIENKTLKIKDTIKNLIIFGNCYSIDEKLDTIYINNKCLNYKVNNFEYYNLIKDFVKEYKLRKNISDKFNIKLIILGTNPNNTYSLTKGIYDNKYTDLNLITDGVGYLNKYKIYSTTKNYFKNPDILCKNIICNEIGKLKVERATFCIAQNIIDKRVVSATIYSEILQKEKLEEIANYCYLEKSKEKQKVFKME